jgi:hypothetical protein
MALNPRSVTAAAELLQELFPDQEVQYLDQNKYGAHEVYIFTDSMVQTRELAMIVECSKKIGNTVSIGRVKGHDGTCVCFW